MTCQPILRRAMASIVLFETTVLSIVAGALLLLVREVHGRENCPPATASERIDAEVQRTASPIVDAPVR